MVPHPHVFFPSFSHEIGEAWTFALSILRLPHTEEGPTAYGRSLLSSNVERPYRFNWLRFSRSSHLRNSLPNHRVCY